MKLDPNIASSLFGDAHNVGSIPGVIGPDGDDVAALDLKIETLNSDILKTPEPEGHALDPKPVAWRRFKIDWTSFRVEWSGWKEAHTEFTSMHSEEGASSFQHIVSEYNVFLDRFKKDFSGATDAAHTETPTGTTSSLDSLPSLGTLVWVGAGVFAIWLFVSVRH